MKVFPPGTGGSIFRENTYLKASQVENCLPTSLGCPNVLAKINERWGFERDRKQKLQRETLNPLEPSYWVLLENPFHNLFQFQALI